MQGAEQLIDLALRLIGAFYVLAGVVGARAALMNALMDRALAMLTLKTGPSRAKSTWMLAGAVLVMAGGVGLILKVDLACAFFVLSAIGQAAFIYVVAPRYFDADDPPDEDGRRQTTNAFFIYSAATAIVGWALFTGRLTPWQEAEPILLGLAGAVIAGLAMRWGWQLASPAAGLQSGAPGAGAWPAPDNDDGAPLLPAPDPATSRNIRVRAECQCHPLWANDPGIYGNIGPEELGLSPALVRDLTAWAEDYDTSVDLDDPVTPQWTPERTAAHDTRGRRLAERLARELPDRTITLWTPEGDIEIRP